MNVRQMASRLLWILNSQLGLDPKRMYRSIRGVPKYLRDVIDYRSRYTGRFEFLPCLHDWQGEGGEFDIEYFLQDLLVARMIFAARPLRHVDVGSRVDGFVSHVASFRDIEVFDVRPITVKIPGVSFTQADLMGPLDGLADSFDSLSCLHALEHFGLGRYGDPINPKGFERGIANMAALVREGGVVYLSVPIGVDRVEFNAHRVFDPRVLIDCAKQCFLRLSGLTVVHVDGKVENSICDEMELHKLANQRYALGIFVFQKVQDNRTG